METDACEAGKGDPMCVGDLDSYGVEIGRGMQIHSDDRHNRDRGSERPDYESGGAGVRISSGAPKCHHSE